MAKLFFDIEIDDQRYTDEDGIDVPDIDAGRVEALRTLGQIAKDALPNGDHQTINAYVRDASGRLAYSATLTVEGMWHSDRPA